MYTPWDSHGSIASKRSILIGETRRAVSRSTDSLSRNKSLHEIKSIFTNNGYPKKFINSVMQQTLHTQPQRENTEKYVYLKLLFINEELKRRALSIVRRTGLENIRLHFDNGPSLSKILAPRKGKLNCNSRFNVHANEKCSKPIQ